MIESEFQALIEATKPDQEPQPTPEQLHALFWGQPIPKPIGVLPPSPKDAPRPDWFDLRNAEASFNDYERQRRRLHQALLAQNKGMAGQDSALLNNALAAAKPTPGRYVVQIMSAGQWFDIDDSRTDDQDAAVRWLERQRTVQPHLILRVHSA